MGSGLLTGTMTRERIADLPEDDWRRRGPQFQEPLVTRNLKIADKLKEMFRSGKRANGSAIQVMPFEALRELNDTDVAALHVYLRSLSPRQAGGH